MHPRFGHQPLVFDDSFAARLLGDEARARIAGDRQLFCSEGMRLIRSMMMMRSRFAEDELATALAAGTRQYVILGAGLDSFAWRQPPEAPALTIYEVDHPDTQRWKQERLRSAGLAAPGNLRFVPADLGRASLAHALAAAGFDAGAPAFFTWVGVTYYLERAAFLDTLRFIGSAGPPGQVVFDVALRGAAVAVEHREFTDGMTRYLEQAGEPWRLDCEPGELQRELHGLGFDSVAFLGPGAADARYLAGRRDGLRAGPLVGLVSARASGRNDRRLAGTGALG
ncbi:MAG: class I SAM-dependent methyltransferase [Gammaproteobacteria bacterium]|nr:class I SAM-dependent methyltransferase [Gammaproteobacteria bacterium]